MGDRIEHRMHPVGIHETLTDRLYLPAILKGLWVTFKHLVRPWKHTTIEYPEERWKPYRHYRGAHRLNKDAQGRIKCVACEMCATACPAHCIHIVPQPTPPEWTDRERMPARFDIDMLRCIYCGYCEEACPVEAIELTEVYDVVGTSRQDLWWTREKLLEMYDRTVGGQYYAGQPGTFSRQPVATR